MAKLTEALELLRARLETGLSEGGARRGAPLVALASCADNDHAANRLLLTLVAVRSGPRLQAPKPGAPSGSDESTIEAELLLTANFAGQYARGLSFFADALDWLHANPVLTQSSGDTVALDFVDLSFEDAAHVIAVAGIKGMPYALYRIRGITMGD